MRESVKILSEKIVKQYLSVEDVIEQVEKTWRWYGEGKVVMPSKITLDMSVLGVNGWINSMPSYIQETDLAAIKWVGGFEDNKKQGLPYIKSKLMLANPHNGMLQAVVSGDWISEFRTGAQPAIAAKYLAASTDVVTIIGAGVQGHSSLLCMSKILPLKEVRICDLNAQARESFISKFDNPTFRMISCDNLETACCGSDIIITVTTANCPLVMDSWVKPGALVLTMGSYTETDEALVRNADHLIVDHIGQALHRGNLYEMAKRSEVTEDSFSTTLPDVVAGRSNGRTAPTDRIVVGLIGMGAPDAAVAALLLQRIAQSGECVPEVCLD